MRVTRIHSEMGVRRPPTATGTIPAAGFIRTGHGGAGEAGFIVHEGATRRQ